MPHPLPTALGVCSLAGMALIWRDIGSKMKGENRTFGSLLSQYLAVKGVGWLGKRQRRKLEADTLNVRRAQEETLLKRLSKNANTYYGRQYDMSSITGEKTECEWKLGNSCNSTCVCCCNTICPPSSCDVTLKTGNYITSYKLMKLVA